jgi:mRNA-degrading endonuclease RelE of RelBE toxin-antitoxin system
MDSYRIERKRSATQELRKLPREMVGRILKAVEQLPGRIAAREIAEFDHRGGGHGELHAT